MFRGVNAINVDAKGRLAVPTRYRQNLSEICNNSLILTVTFGEDCLSLYPLPEWELIEREVVALPGLDPTSQRIKRLLLGHATECELDKNGRMLVPGELREYAHLEKHAVFIGQGNKFEIWDQDLWNGKRAEWLKPSQESGPLPLVLEKLSL